ncbi:hypothetical protein GA0115246_1125611 [Streptomyces sp. SolWspMP-sol7th]|nr:hypothetical protein GA0115246_1125611 [Streptomyces sp. SolWspMP-sol7th]
MTWSPFLSVRAEVPSLSFFAAIWATLEESAVWRSVFMLTLLSGAVELSKGLVVGVRTTMSLLAAYESAEVMPR